MPASILTLEDEAYRIDCFREFFAPEEVAGTDDVELFLRWARRGSWRLILLDHDLSREPGAATGFDAAERLGDASGDAFSACAYVPIVVHSLNLHEAGSIVKALWAWEAPIVRIPFHRMAEYTSWLRTLAGL